MDVAMQLPIALDDAHLSDVQYGYGLPLGGVLATPANLGVLGIISGSMTAPGFTARGRGERDSINSRRRPEPGGAFRARTQAKAGWGPVSCSGSYASMALS